MWPDSADMVYYMKIAADLTKQPHPLPLYTVCSAFRGKVPKKQGMPVGGFAEKQVYEDRGPHNLLGGDNAFTNQVCAAEV